jgi:hypothetical protein
MDAVIKYRLIKYDGAKVLEEAWVNGNACDILRC